METCALTPRDGETGIKSVCIIYYRKTVIHLIERSSNKEALGGNPQTACGQAMVKSGRDRTKCARIDLRMVADMNIHEILPFEHCKLVDTDSLTVLQLLTRTCGVYRTECI